MLASCSEPKISSSTLVSRSASERKRDMSTFGAGISSLKQVTTAAVLSSEETLESFPQTLDEASAKLVIRQGELPDNASDDSLDYLAIDLVHQAIHYSLSLMFD